MQKFFLQPSGRPRSIRTLDGWRAIAIGMVVAHHTGMSLFARESDYYASSVTRFGAFGVDIFFGLSGFLITKLLLDEQGRTGTINLPAFYSRRAFRILPVVLVLLAVLALLRLLRSGLEVGSSVFFFRNYLHPSLGTHYSGHLWSLSVEEHFYLFWPALLVVVPPVHIRTLAPWLAVAFGLWRVASAELHLSARFLPDIPPHFRTDLRLDALLWGCVLAFVGQNPASREQLRRSLNPAAWTALIGAVLFLMVSYSYLASVLLAFLIPMLLTGTVLHPEWRISRFLDFAPVAWIGRISYGLYIWQQLFLVPGWEPRFEWQEWPWNLPLAFCLAVVSYYLIELPAIRLGRHICSNQKCSRKVYWTSRP